ncbi:MAG: lactate utilization protein [Chloroflexota bacterium]
MDTRNQILTKLRTALNKPVLPFPSYNPPPLLDHMNVTAPLVANETDIQSLALRFGQELENLQGTYEIVETAIEARLALTNRLLDWMRTEEMARKGTRHNLNYTRSVLSWSQDALPVSGLQDTFSDMGINLVSPAELRSQESRDQVRLIRYGLTGVEAAFASTGSMMMVTRPQTSRSASLLPIRHIALIPFNKLYPTMEDWVRTQRGNNEMTSLMRNHANLSMISGPSKSADIEGTLTLGVHGPKFVHAILFKSNE